jgi:hypothetical protein
MTHPQLALEFDAIKPMTFRNFGYGYQTSAHACDLSELLTFWGIDHDLDANRDEHGYTHPTLVIHSHGDMELVKLRLQKRFIKVDIYRSKSVQDLYDAEMKASFQPQTVNVNYDWSAELTLTLKDYPHLVSSRTDWLAQKTQIVSKTDGKYLGDIGYLPLSGCHYYRLRGQGSQVTIKVSTMKEALEKLSSSYDTEMKASMEPLLFSASYTWLDELTSALKDYPCLTASHTELLSRKTRIVSTATGQYLGDIGYWARYCCHYYHLQGTSPTSVIKVSTMKEALDKLSV